mmetsp:Transcript_5684/g.7471  ORF Transcript_5684/g.7471 Transcript_5684/m.7471 type:complete len:172 (+) Transcript_5684:130-645(+)|eukprot:CAMPEP_0198143160 /NCGR_PEP_ID=MMETSP1443-20131203/5915_1 /TAXON_ID=186043 /ORGANISM="Entomoneis sp., Strain CCMP2396" /LENGTH=171 /DNA_ID=CAMNT_0043806329 /DNA_START=66 /DNA_END=581 /DNA_ORIENTATION=+
MKAIICFLIAVLPQTLAFTTLIPSVSSPASRQHHHHHQQQQQQQQRFELFGVTTPTKLSEHHGDKNGWAKETRNGLTKWATATSLALLTVVVSSTVGVLPALAAAEDEVQQFAALPPPYVPALFGVGLIVGVGLLTGSLGNVMDEEASLGLQSGARAKKEIERSRSSYFKK